MPFKIVETTEKGKIQLSIVPNRWGKKGLLRWPPKKCATTNKLLMDENSFPLADWLSIKCTVKHTSIPSYSRAEEEINLMTQNSDTDVADIDMRNVENTTNINYNDMAASLIFHRNNEPEASISFDLETVPEQTSKNLIQIISDGGNLIATADINHEQANFDKVLLNQKSILDNQITIMQNQSLLHDTQKALLEQEKKNFRQSQNLSAQLDYYFKRSDPSNSNVVLLSECNSFDTQSFTLKPMSNIQDLHDLEEKLANKTQNKLLRQQYSLLCSKSEGSGTKCSYKLLDLLFTKEFLCEFSWSGGSRGNKVKVALKGYKSFLLFFFKIINNWDPLFTQSDTEEFFKTVLKNSVKRLQTKNLRASSKRQRQRKINTNKQQKTLTTNANNENEWVFDTKNNHKEENVHIQSEEEMENYRSSVLSSSTIVHNNANHNIDTEIEIDQPEYGMADEEITAEIIENASDDHDDQMSIKNKAFKETSV